MPAWFLTFVAASRKRVRPIRTGTVRVRARQSGVPRILPVYPSDCTTSSLTLTTCPGWPGPGRRRSAEGCLRARERDRRRDRRERTGGHVLHAGHRSQDGQEPRASRPDHQRRRPRSGDRPPSCAWRAGSRSGRPAQSPGLSLSGCPGRDKATAPGQLGGLGFGLAGLRRRRIRNPGSLLSFS